MDPGTEKILPIRITGIQIQYQPVNRTNSIPSLPEQKNTQDKAKPIPNDLHKLYNPRINFKPILVAPISGGCFPHQLSGIRKLSRSGLEPFICLGASGGNVSFYLSLAGRWKPDGIERVASGLNEKFFIKSWYPYISDHIPESAVAIASYFKGSIYKSSDLGKCLFDAYFSPGEIAMTEIWIGAVNERTGGLALFGNRCREHSKIKGNYLDRRMFKIEPLNWLNADSDLICKAILASSAVPTVVDPVQIGDNKYVDCGVKFASPLCPLRDEIKAIAKSHDYNVHIIYFSGYNVESDIQVAPLNNMLQHGKVIGSHVVRAMVMHDRDAARQIVTEISSACHNSSYVCHDDEGDVKIHFFDVESKAINAVYERLYLTKCCLFELYPTNPDTLDYTKFTGEDVIRIMNKTDSQMAAHLWWSGDADIFEGIDGVIGNIYK